MSDKEYTQPVKPVTVEDIIIEADGFYWSLTFSEAQDFLCECGPEIAEKLRDRLPDAMQELLSAWLKRTGCGKPQREEVQ